MDAHERYLRQEEMEKELQGELEPEYEDGISNLLAIANETLAEGKK